MIRHIVLFSLKDNAEGGTKNENALKIKYLLESLPQLISQIKSFECGINIVESERSYDLSWTISCENLKDLDTYIEHPEHKKVAEFVMKVRNESHVVDYEF